MKSEENKKSGKKKIKIIILILILIILVTTTVCYIVNEDIRQYIDYNLLGKITTENDTKTIDLSDDNTASIYAYDNYISILNNNILSIYNSSAKKNAELNIAITNPIFESNNKYLAIAEKGGKKIYLVSGKNILWQNNIDGEISRVNINRNGFVTVIVSQNTYKTVVITFNTEGRELFKTYLSDSYAIDTDISNDNKYLAIAEVNTDGTVVQSNIRILSLEKLETDAENSTIYNQKSETNQLITGIKYNDTGNLIAMYDSGVNIIKDGQEKEIINFSADTLFSNIELNKEIVETKQTQKEELKIKIKTSIINTINNQQSSYTVDAIPKEIQVKKDTVAINTGMEAYFIDNHSWLKKKYNSNQEIKEIVLGDSIAGIVYKNKVNIIKI